MKSPESKRNWMIFTNGIVYIVIALFLFFFLFPIFWVIITSLKSRVQTFAIPPVWIFKPIWQSYRAIFTEMQFSHYLLNSAVIAILNTVLVVFTGSLAAYSIARFKTGGNNLSFWILSIRMIPPIVVTVPLFIALNKLRMIDTHLALILLYTTLNLPLAVWIMRAFFMEIPGELEESAMIDGCSRMQALWRIVLPLARPGLAATAIFCFIFSWNEFLFALIFTRIVAKTAPLAMTTLMTEREIYWGNICAGATLVIVPVIVFSLIVQKHIVRGLTFGAIK